MESSLRFGLSCALALPLNEDGSIDYRLLVAILLSITAGPHVSMVPRVLVSAGNGLPVLS
jgi:hypothetical protein